MEYSIIFAGKAGQGANTISEIFSKVLVEKGFYVFNSRDYQSLIRGGNNFNEVLISDKPIFSNESKFDLLVALDENSVKLHKSKLKKKGKILSGSGNNILFLGKLFKLFNLEFSLLNKEIKEIQNYDSNLIQAKKGYEEEISCFELKNLKNKLRFYTGSNALSEASLKSGLDIYYAYPMTPATAVLGELAQSQKENNILVLELENEIAVANAGAGSAITGAKVMVGTSGGGFDLMTEALSMCGIARIPLIFYLAQRPGPASGVATYQAQGDLDLARNSGHGEFPRIILAPGDPLETEELTSQAFYLSQKLKFPTIILSDKHLAESYYSIDKKPKMIKSRKLTNFGRYNSYEKDQNGSATEDSNIIKKNIQERWKDFEVLKRESRKFTQYKIYGEKKSKNCILFWGSTKGAILDSIKGLDVSAVQILYIEPFPEKISSLIKGKNLILIENNSTGQLGKLIREKTGIEIKNKILRYDGRPFYYDELKGEIKKRLK